MPVPSPPKLEITTVDGDQSSQDSPQSITTFVASPSSPTASTRRPSEAATLLPNPGQLSALQPSTSHKTYLDADQSRSRSSSVAGASMLSGDTARPETPYHGGVEVDQKILVEQLNTPDPGTEADFQAENNAFAFTPGQMNKFINPKNLDAYHAVGGIRGLEKGLRTDLQAGLSIDEGALDGRVTFEDAVSAARKNAVSAQSHQAGVTRTSTDLSGGATISKAEHGRFSDRKRVFKDNTLPQKSAKSIFQLMWEQYNDKILILLTIAAVVSLALGIYESVGVKHPAGSPPSLDWIEGVAICVAIIIVVLVGAVNDWQKERQFVKLNAKKEDRNVKAIRSGKSVEISVHDILVGDIIHLEPGDMLPTDGIFISGHNVKCDESSATGESDQMKKTPGEEVYRQLENGTANLKLDPFLIAGSKVLEGVGIYLVTATGVNSSFGKLVTSMQGTAEDTPLQVKLGKLADAIAYLGGGAALFLFSVLFFRWCAGLPQSTISGAEKGSEFLDIVIVAITLVVVAIPEGLPLAVTLALAFATTRMLKENNLVRVLRACETMGNATTVCSDKTGTLTTNKMTVVAGTISKDAKFGSGETDDELAPRMLTASFSNAVKYLLLQSIAINSTAFEGDDEEGRPTYIGSKTETAMLTFARDYLGLAFLQSERDTAQIVQMIPFDSGRKCMGVVVRLDNGVYRLYVKGASEILLAKASSYITDVTANELEIAALTEKDVLGLDSTINAYAERSLRTIAMLYKDYTQWPPVGCRTLEEDPSHADFDDLFNQMVFLGIVGIQDPLRPGVTEAVEQCTMAGVKVRMVTGDNVVTARAIATECGIFTEGGVVMEGPNFRRLSEEDMNDVLPRLQVLARSSPEDKKILVQRLKALNETVAVTGDGTNDGPALKMADVGFSMGIAGTEVAKEASSIILMDDNFASIIKALMWGRAVNDAVQKFLQFQLTVNITAVLVTFVSAVSSSTRESVLTAVQLLWVNLIMDTFAALALATDAPTPEILKRKPARKTASLVTLNMWKMIIGQAFFQLIVTYIMYFGGKDIFPASWLPLADSGKNDKILSTIVFNTFVWMQIFNEFNNRRLDNKFNIFEGITKNYFFIGINCIMVGGQIMIIFVGNAAFSIQKLNGPQWAVCILVSALCLPWAMVVRSIPDEFVGRSWASAVGIFGPPVMAVVGFFASFWRSISNLMGRKNKDTKSDEEAPENKKGKSAEP